MVWQSALKRTREIIEPWLDICFFSQLHAQILHKRRPLEAIHGARFIETSSLKLFMTVLVDIDMELHDANKQWIHG